MTQRSQLLTRLAASIADIRRDHTIRVAVDGVDAAGKTTLANELVAPVETLGRPVIRASIDGFHNPAAVRRRRGAESPQGYYHDSFDHDALLGSLLRPLGPGGSNIYRSAVFDFRSDTHLESPLREAAPHAVLLFDGVFLLRPELRDHWDLSVFVRADFEVTMRRALVRDRELFGTTADTRRRYENRYVPGQRIYLAEARPERYATVIIDNNDPEHPRIERP